MKTTVEIDEPLLREAKQMAARDRTSLRALIEQGLRTVLAERTRPKKTREWKIVPFKGDGLTDEFKDATWDDYLEAIYGTSGFDRD